MGNCLAFLFCMFSFNGLKVVNIEIIYLRPFVKKLFMVLFTSSFIFADSCMPCDPCEPCPCPEFTPCPPPSICAFNAPSKIELLCQWDLTISASFIWWEAKEDNIEPGVIKAGVNISPNPTNYIPIQEQIIQSQMDYKYKPGFKVGLGVNYDCDNWRLYTEYTYLHPSTSGSAVAEAPEDPITDSFISTKWWLLDVTEPGRDFNSISTTWDLDVDIIDLELSRKYYVGNSLTFNTIVGLKAAWVGQKYTTKMQELDPDGAVYREKNETENWGVGPRMGLGTNWVFCNGFRIFANGCASILFTKFTTDTINASLENAIVATLPPLTYSANYRGVNYCSLKPEADMSLGLGWGDNFCCNKWYFDVEVGYTFMMFWDQNQFHTFVDGENDFYVRDEGNLILHGLTVTARVDF